MGAALGVGDGVTKQRVMAVLIVVRPGNRPFDTALAIGQIGIAVKRLRDEWLALKLLHNAIMQAAGEMDDLARRDGAAFADQFRCAVPTHLDATEEVGFRANQFIDFLGPKFRFRTKNFGIGVKGDTGAATIFDRAELLNFTLRCPARIILRIKLLVAGHFHAHRIRQCIHDRNAHTV